GRQLGLGGNLAADVADEAAEPRAQQAQLPMVTLELLGMSIARSHHRRMLGDAQIRLPQPYSAFIGQEQIELAAQPLPPMAQVRALMRERVLEEHLAGEVLEIRIIDPALAHAL